MKLKEKLALLGRKSQELVIRNSQGICQNYERTQLDVGKNLSDLKESLSTLKQNPAYPTVFSVQTFAQKVQLIILLDKSSSMVGTEEDIYEGLKELCSKHINDNIVVTWINFSDEMEEFYKDEPISSVRPKLIQPCGNTNLNELTYKMIQEYGTRKDAYNLFVTISDGAGNIHRIKEEQVRKLMQDHNSENNSFYFLGEAGKLRTEEQVFVSAAQLGYNEGNIVVFTRREQGNIINFQVISNMLDDLLKSGTIRPDWNEPIKEHYLRLTNKRGR